MYQNQRAQKETTTSDFEFLSKLGQGSFGVVYKVRRKFDKNIYVLKQINIAQMNPQMRKEALNEVKILSCLDNPYIVKYFESFLEKSYLNIVMEFCEGGDLANYIKVAPGRALAEPKIWKFLIQMCLGLAYIHSKKVLHRDIKSMNVFLSKNEDVRIGDLGVAKALAETNNFANTMIGTPYYLSPEMCEEKPYNSKSDMWAFGCVIYEMCTKRHPFEATNQAALILKIITGKFAPIPPTFSPELTEILNQCLCKDYKKRPSASTIVNKPAFQIKAKELNISLGDIQAPEVLLQGVSPNLLPKKVQGDRPLRRLEDQPLPRSEKESISSNKEKSPIPRINVVPQKEYVDNRIITPSANNAFKVKPAVKVPSKEELRPKTPVEHPREDILKRNVPQRDLSPKPAVGREISPRPNLKRDKSPQPEKPKPKEEKPVQKEVPASNVVGADRNIKRIRKGAPQALGRQAVNAGNRAPPQKVKLDSPSLHKPELPQSKSRSPLGRDVSGDRSRTPTSRGSDRPDSRKGKEVERPITPLNKEIPAPIIEAKQEETLGFVVREEDLEQDVLKRMKEFKREETIPEKKELVIEDKESEEDKNEDDLGNTAFEPVTQVSWNVVEEPKIEPAKNVENKPKQELDEIPVFHVAKDVPEFEINAMSPEAHEDNDDEEHEYWDSNEDEIAYDNDRFEDENSDKEERKDNRNRGYESPEYEEDFESDGETEDTNRKSSYEKADDARKEVVMKKLEKAKKDREDVEKLIKDRSSPYVKQMGEDGFKEMMGFLRKKLESAQGEEVAKEIEDFIKKKVGGKLPQDQIAFILVKILPFEMRKAKLEEEIRGYNFELQ